MQDYDKRITAIYNDCWKLYREYTKTYDMGHFNRSKNDLVKKYGCQADVIDLVLWISIRVQTMHDMQEGVKRCGRS